MALEYHTNMKFEQLAPVLEDYADWFAQLSQAIAYPDEDSQLEKITSPSSFQAWLDESSQGGLNPDLIADISSIYIDMLEKGEELVQTLLNNAKPEFEDFYQFKSLYSSFLTRLRRLEKDSAMEGSGFDEQTGFRSRKVIQTDQKKEMERLKRQGTPFCLVIVRIDEFGRYVPDNILPFVVQNIKNCMRTFDDAYYLGDGHFLLSLKQTDIVGAEAAVDRLQIFIRDDETNKSSTTLSYCLAEPVEDDEVMQLLDNMRKDLDAHAGEKDAVLRFLELSPLQKYMNSLGSARSS
jgi:GGDEF domain-containing protein